jgi:hypothetical protein
MWSRITALERAINDLLRRMAAAERRLADLAQQVAQLWARPSGQGGGGTTVVLGLIGEGGISGRSGTTAGSGTVARHTIDAGTLTDVSANVTAYSYATQPIAAGLYCAMAQINGQWVILSVECPP